MRLLQDTVIFERLRNTAVDSTTLKHLDSFAEAGKRFYRVFMPF